MQIPASSLGFTTVAFDPLSRVLYAGGGGMQRETGKSFSKTVWELAAWILPVGSSAELLWHVQEQAKSPIFHISLRPGVPGTLPGAPAGELAAQTTSGTTIWSTRGEKLRAYKTDFLCGNLVYSPDGARFVAPKGNVLSICAADTAEKLAQIKLDESDYHDAAGAAFLADGQRLFVVSSQINDCGQRSGVVQLVDAAAGAVLLTAKVDMSPQLVAVDPQGRWAAVAGEKKSKGAILFWDLSAWKMLAEQVAHAGGIDGLAMSPDGEQLATTGNDHVIRIWDRTKLKTVVKLEPPAEDKARAEVAWSPNGQYLAFAAWGKPPGGGLFLYARNGDKWDPVTSGSSSPPKETENAGDLRPIRIFGREPSMDTVGDMEEFANRWPVKCPHCTFPDLDAVPQPYLLSRGFQAAGDCDTAALGNFLVRARAKQLFEIILPGLCEFYPTIAARTQEPTDWFLAVPQVIAPAHREVKGGKTCSKCWEKKLVDHLEPQPPLPTPADIFKSREWTARQIGEEAKWYVDKHFQTEKPPKQQWTRLGLSRGLWFSTRLLFLLKEMKLRGFHYGHLDNRKPTPEEAAWVKEKAALLQAAPPVMEKPPSDDRAWFREFLAAHASEKPLTTPAELAAWQQEHGIQLPGAYVEFVTTLGAHEFDEMFGEEGYSVKIVGPKDLDDRDYRRDPPQDGEIAEPDGLLFAVAINGDVLCFDLSAGPNYPVVHLDHETSIFQPFANNFIAAVKRLAEKN